MVKAHWLCEPGLHCGSSTCELGTKATLPPGTRGLPWPATTGGVTDDGRVGNVIALPSIPTRKALDGVVPLLPLQSTAVPELREGPKHKRLCEKPSACRVSMAVCTPFKRSKKCQ